MADETKTQIPKPTRQRGPMGRMGGMGRGEKPKDFKGTMRQLLGYIGQHKIAVFAAVAFAVCSVIFNIVGPKVLGQVTTKLFEGLVAKVNGTGDVDFAWIAKTLGFLLCLYLASSICSLIQGWLMTGVTQKICYRMRKEIAAKIAVVPMGYFNGHSKGDVLSRITNDVDTLGQSLSRTSESSSRFWAPSTALSRKTLPARTSFRCSTAPRPRSRSSTVKTTASLLVAGARSSCRA